MRYPGWLAALALFAAAGAARSETVELTTGETLVGDVRLEGAGEVVIDVRWPETRTVTLKRSDLTPQSLFRVLERRVDPKDAAQRRELADAAEELGLHAAALAEYRRAKELDPGSAKDIDARIAHVLEAIAADVLEDAKDLLAAGSARAALMYLHTVRELYPDTAAAKEAAKLSERAHEQAGAAADVALRTVPAAQAPGLADEVEAHLAKGDDAAKGAGGHAGASVRDQRAIERAVTHYERAWEAAKRLPVVTEDDALDSRIARLRRQAKTSLVNTYLTAGTALLQRRALPAAERYCDAACELDPENKENHALHRLIVQAKLAYGWGRSGR